MSLFLNLVHAEARRKREKEDNWCNTKQHSAYYAVNEYNQKLDQEEAERSYRSQDLQDELLQLQIENQRLENELLREQIKKLKDVITRE